MNSQTLTNVGIIIGGLVGLIGVLIAWRQSKIVADQRLSELIADKVKDATDPLIAQIAQQERVIARREATIDRLASRVDQLEDELRRGRGHGDNDAQRQPPGRG